MPLSIRKPMRAKCRPQDPVRDSGARLGIFYAIAAPPHSGVSAIGALRLIRNFSYYDPRLLRVFGWELLLSTIATLLSPLAQAGDISQMACPWKFHQDVDALDRFS